MADFFGALFVDDRLNGNEDIDDDFNLGDFFGQFVDENAVHENEGADIAEAVVPFMHVGQNIETSEEQLNDNWSDIIGRIGNESGTADNYFAETIATFFSCIPVKYFG